MGTRSWSDEDLIAAIAGSINYSQLARAIGLKNGHGNRQSVQKAIKRLGIDVSHFTGAGPPRSAPAHKIPWREVFVERSTYSTSRLRKRLVEDMGRADECARCGISSWHGSDLVLETHHENGISDDNRVDNLELLCPNCHSVATREILALARDRKANRCIDCGKIITRQATRCYSCSSFKSNKTKIDWPDYNGMLELMEESGWNYSKVGRNLGVSDNAVRKHIISRERQSERRKLCPQSICSDTPVL